MDPLLIYTTDTTKFLLPLVVKEGYTYKDIQTNLIGAYISLEDMPMYDQSIVLVFNEDIKPTYLKDDYIDNFIIINSKHTELDYVYVYNIEDDILEDYIQFIQGQYSLLTTETKQKILKFWDIGTDTFLYSILYKDLADITAITEKYNNLDNPWYHVFDKWNSQLKKNKELYRSPDLLKEMYSYISEV